MYFSLAVYGVHRCGWTTFADAIPGVTYIQIWARFQKLVMPLKKYVFWPPGYIIMYPIKLFCCVFAATAVHASFGNSVTLQQCIGETKGLRESIVIQN